MVKWGILGSGLIASDFAKVLSGAEGAELEVVAASSLDKAQKFASEHSVARAVESYEALAKDPNVEIVYVSTIHPRHHEQTLLCLNHGKHVLVEKPMAINAKQASEMIELARKNKLFLMEGMWTRFMPAVQKATELVRSGAIGKLVAVQGDFGFVGSLEKQPRLFNLEEGGGGLLDIGCYPLAMASLMFDRKEPTAISAVAVLGDTGVDLSGTMCLQYGKEGVATILWSIQTNTQEVIHMYGTKGCVSIESPAHSPERCLLKTKQGGVTKEEAFHYHHPPAPEAVGEFNFHNSEALLYEVQEVHKCLKEGKTESEIMPLEESLVLARILDKTRELIGLSYPFESANAKSS
eukprot:c14992_g1_i1.p1 GENE.c14992_g1_i1~~c14992_g1_i1.p1  ORF type:complete len:362 (-),score=94.59 c14992_g1_i1:102-1151(-)